MAHAHALPFWNKCTTPRYYVFQPTVNLTFIRILKSTARWRAKSCKAPSSITLLVSFAVRFFVRCVCACLLPPPPTTAQQQSSVNKHQWCRSSTCHQVTRRRGAAMEYSSPLVVLLLQQQYTETEFSACSLAFYKSPAEQVPIFNL